MDTIQILKTISFFIVMYLSVYWIMGGRVTFWENFAIVFVASLFVPVGDYCVVAVNNSANIKQFSDKSVNMKEDPMFMFSNNHSSPLCCLSGKGNTYFTDTGCVCITKKQEKQFIERGGNHPEGQQCF